MRTSTGKSNIHGLSRRFTSAVSSFGRTFLPFSNRRNFAVSFVNTIESKNQTYLLLSSPVRFLFLQLMSTLSSISTSQPVSLECSTYSPNTEQFIMCIGSMNAAKDACVVSNLFDSENKSHEQLAHLLHRLYDQRAKLTEFYNREIEICEATEKLIRFLDQIDFVLDQYEQDSSSLDSLNIIVGSNQSIDEENYAEYLRGERYFRFHSFFTCSN